MAMDDGWFFEERKYVVNSAKTIRQAKKMSSRIRRHADKAAIAEAVADLDAADTAEYVAMIDTIMWELEWAADTMPFCGIYDCTLCD